MTIGWPFAKRSRHPNVSPRTDANDALWPVGEDRGSSALLT